MALNPVLEAFSLSHAEVLDGTKSFFEEYALTAGIGWDIYGVSEASLDPDTDSFDNEGDDVVESTWAWLNFADVKVTAGYLSFPLISTLTGRAYATSTLGGKGTISVDLWHEDSFNVSPKPMLIRMPSRDNKGVAADLVIGLFKVQFKPITFDGPAYKDGLKVNYEGKALYSAFDEKGVAFGDGKKRVGVLLGIER